MFWESDFRADADALGIHPYEANLAVLRSDRYKFVQWGSPVFPPLLFDLTLDPAESVDKSSDPAYAKVLVECMGEMLRWRSRHNEHSMTHLNLGKTGAAKVFPTLHDASLARL
eukprot:COSAG05_NODE_3107_length_2319_cov_1.320721_2_plen_113_part_00